MTAAEVEAICLALPGAHKVRLWERLEDIGPHPFTPVGA